MFLVFNAYMNMWENTVEVPTQRGRFQSLPAKCEEEIKTTFHDFLPDFKVSILFKIFIFQKRKLWSCLNFPSTFFQKTTPHIWNLESFVLLCNIYHTYEKDWLFYSRFRMVKGFCFANPFLKALMNLCSSLMMKINHYTIWVSFYRAIQK